MLKGKLQRALRTTGHYTRLDVKVATDTSDTRSRVPAELTDIDVLGIAFDADLRPTLVTGDCTTRARISPAARAFWLRGVMTFFQATRGYIVLTRAVDAHERQVAASLGIQLMAESDLDRWLLRLPESGDGTDGVQRWLELERGLQQLPGTLQELVAYRKYGFWQDDPNQSILRIVRLVRDARPSLEGRDRWHRALVVDVCGLLSLSLLRMTHAVFNSPPDGLPDAARSYLFGGSRSLRFREQVLERVRQITSSSRKSSGGHDDIALDPPYWPQLVDLVARLAEHPMDARAIPIELEQILYDFEPFDPAQTITLPRKLAWDIGRFFVRASRLDGRFGGIFGLGTSTSEPNTPPARPKSGSPMLLPPEQD